MFQQRIEQEYEQFHMDKIKTDFWSQLVHGGHKYRKINVQTLIPPKIFDKYVFKYNNTKYGQKTFKIQCKLGIWSTKNGYCPYGFLKQLINNGFSLQTQNQHSNLPLELVNVYNENVIYSTRTNVFKICAHVTWSVDQGKTWQKLYDIN